MKSCRELLGLSQQAFADQLGLALRTYQNYERGDRTVTKELMDALWGTFGVDPIWVMRGSGEMRRVMSSIEEPPAVNGPAVGVDKGRYASDSFHHDFALVPRYRVHASAGSGSVVESEEIDGHVAFRRDYLRREGLHVRNLATLYARGDSMSPTIRDRALLLVDVSIDKAKEEGVYLLSRDDGALSVKRVQPVGNARLRVISDNPAYPPLDLDTPELSVRGLVVLVSQRP